MNVFNKCKITPVYIIESFSDFTDVILRLSRRYRYQIVLTN